MQTISFTFNVNASTEEVLEGIEVIGKFFGIQTDDTIDADDTTGAPPAAVAVAVGDHDANGLPWDERIHASTKAKNADGSWRYRKGVADTQKSKVEKELRAALAANPAPSSPTPALPAALPATPGLPAAAPALPTVNPAYTAFVEFIAARTVPAPGARLTPEWVQQALTTYGVENGQMQNLAHRVDLIPQITAAIKTALGEA